MTDDELGVIENEITELLPKVVGKGRATLIAALIDIQATRLHLLGAAMGDLGHTAEAHQAEGASRLYAALAAKGLKL